MIKKYAGFVMDICAPLAVGIALFYLIMVIALPTTFMPAV